MDIIIQKRTDCTPEVNFDPNGKLLIEGRSFSENPHDHFNPLIDFCKKLKAGNVVFDIKMDYLNTASSKCLYEVINSLDTNSKLEKITIQWHYEEDDDEMEETAEIFAEMCKKAKVVLIPVAVNDFNFSM